MIKDSFSLEKKTKQFEGSECYVVNAKLGFKDIASYVGESLSQLNVDENSDLKIEKLSKSEDLSFFSCGCKDLDLFFQKEIHLCIKYKYVSAYCVKDILDNSIVALFTLSHDSVLLSCDSEKNEFIEEVSDRINGEYQYIFEKQSIYS